MVDTERGDKSTVENCSLLISDDSGDRATINMIGEIDLFSAPTVYAWMWKTSLNGKRSLIVNLEDLDFMDSSGLQALLRLREKLRSRKKSIVLTGAKPQIKKLFMLTGFDKLFPELEVRIPPRGREDGG
jgi:anti-sigma B factor antagonist